MKKGSSVFVLIILVITFRACTATFTLETIKQLTTEWSPLVWLAPGERFLPSSVPDFLEKVHPEISTSNSDIHDVNEYPEKYEIYIKDIQQELKKINSSRLNSSRIKRNFKQSFLSFSHLPVGRESESWYLVANEPLTALHANENSFIYGKDPSKEPGVPIYAVVSPCSIEDLSSNSIRNEVTIDKKPFKKSVSSNRYIPLQARSLVFPSPGTPEAAPNETVDLVFAVPADPENATIDVQSNEVQASPKIENPDPPKWALEEGVEWNPSSQNFLRDSQPPTATKKPLEASSFHVTYWMFYPYSQGKSMCSINLGPLGPLPIPLIFGFCFGERKEYGSHVGDWEHVSLFFAPGKREPDELYVSAHDAGAYYAYNAFTRTFEFLRQETRKGIFQKPNFPKTVKTSKNHPILFSARGSHGLWTAPGKHRYVKMPRLYDINGFGTPWMTWNSIEFFMADDVERNKDVPNWLKFRGKWGNQKSKCHPLIRLGLHLCEVSDGPTGIPRKKPNFKCFDSHH